MFVIKYSAYLLTLGHGWGFNPVRIDVLNCGDQKFYPHLRLDSIRIEDVTDCTPAAVYQLGFDDSLSVHAAHTQIFEDL